VPRFRSLGVETSRAGLSNLDVSRRVVLAGPEGHIPPAEPRDLTSPQTALDGQQHNHERFETVLASRGGQSADLLG
jgi:hypothetical protein